MTTALLIAAVVIGLPGLAVAVHLGILAAASLFYREREVRAERDMRLLILIPAHNEEARHRTVPRRRSRATAASATS